MKGSSKEKVLDAAITLFQIKGFHGTSVRDIAQKANVNVALVSYYFGGKQGLLEQLVVQFLEGYLETMESSIMSQSSASNRSTLLVMIEEVLRFEQAFPSLARLVLREITLDSTLAREIMTTYLRKEKHLIESILQKGVQEKEFQKQPFDLIVLHLRSLMTMPYLHPQYLRELYQLTPSDPSFIKRYMGHVTRWIDASIHHKATKRMIVQID